jgi:hypothetical protein
MKVALGLYDTMHGETVARIKMDEELLDPSKGVIDAETMTLRPLKSGGIYTLIPLNDPVSASLEALKEAYDKMQTPSTSLHEMHAKIDNLCGKVGLVFDTWEFITITKPEEIESLINNKGVEDLNRETVTVWGMLEEILGQDSDGQKETA